MTLPGRRVDHDDDRDEALLGEDAAVLEVGIRDLADRRAVDVDEAEVELADDRGDAVAQVDDGAVLADDRALRRDAGVLRELGVGDQVAVLAVHGQHVLRLQDVVAVEQLAGGGVARDVHLGVALVHDVGAELGQAVDHAVDGVLVAGDQARGEDDRVALAQLDLVVVVRHAAEHGHRLALRAGRHVDDLVVRQVARLLVVDQDALGHVQVAELGGDGHVAHHAAAEQRDAAPVGGRGIQHLLHAVHVAREARDDDAARGLADDLVEHRADAALERGEPGHVGVGRVDEEQVDALLAEPREGAQVGDAVVERQLVHLEVAGGEHDAGRGPDRDGERIGDRVVDRDELEVERADLLVLALLDGQRVRLDAVLLELRLDERERQAGADQGDVGLELQQVRDGADVVLVAVGEHDADDVVEAVLDRLEVGQDQVDARLVLLGEEHAAVDDEDLAARTRTWSCCGRSRRARRAG